MKRLLAAAVVPALVALAGCRADTCTSSAATLKNTSAPACSLAPGTATVSVELCSKCSDSTPSCQAGAINCSGNNFTSCSFEVSPSVQQCQQNAGCAINGCNVSVPTATCPLTVPANVPPGDYPLVVVGDGGSITGTLTVGGSNTTCAL